MRMLDRLKRRNSLNIFFLFLLFSPLLAGGDWCALQAQSRPPLVPSLRNDRRMAEEARRQAMDSSFVERPRGGETEPRPLPPSPQAGRGSSPAHPDEAVSVKTSSSATLSPTSIGSISTGHGA